MPAHDAIGERVLIRTDGRFEVAYDAVIDVERLTPALGGLGQLAPHDMPGERARIPARFRRYCPADRFQSIVEDEFGGTSGGERIMAIHDWIARALDLRAGQQHLHHHRARQLRRTARDLPRLRARADHAWRAPRRSRRATSRAIAPGVTPPDFHAIAEVFLADETTPGGGAWYIVDATGMAEPHEAVKIGVGRDAADVSFLTSFGPSQFGDKTVSVDALTSAARGVPQGDAARRRVARRRGARHTLRMDTMIKWIGGATAAVVLAFAGVTAASGGFSNPVEPAPSLEDAIPVDPAALAPKKVTPAPAPAATDDHFTVRRVLPIDGPIKYGEWHWDDANVPDGPVVITVDLDARVLSVFRGGYEIGAAAVLVGTDEYPDPARDVPDPRQAAPQQEREVFQRADAVVNVPDPRRGGDPRRQHGRERLCQPRLHLGPRRVRGKDLRGRQAGRQGDHHPRADAGDGRQDRLS